MPVEMNELQMTIPGAENPMQVSCRILVNNNEPESALPISSIVIDRELNRIPSATITIIDGDVSQQTFPLSDGDLFIPGNRIEIQLGYQANATTIFKGIIVAVGNRINGTTTTLELQCKDEAISMTLEKKYRHWNDVTDSDMATAICQEYGLQTDIAATTVQHTNLMQANITDWDFILYRLDMMGMVVNVENGMFTSLQPDLQSERLFDVVYGATLMQYEATMDARWQSSGGSAASWSYTNQQMTTVEAQEPNLQQGGNIEAASLASGLSYGSNNYRFSAQWNSNELQALADAALAKQRLAKIRGRIRFQGVETAKPGTFIMVAGVGQRFSGPLFISSVQHRYEEGNWIAEAGFGMEPSWFAEKVNPYHPASASGILSTISGLQVGVVTDNEDPAGEFRVMVKLPAVNADEQGIWARVATLDAGDNRGTMYRPEPADEVIVGFIGDDPREPVILGMLHSSARPSAIQPNSSNDVKGYQSREGFKMIFNDDQKSLTVESPEGRKIIINDNDGTITMDDGTGNKMTMNNNGLTVEAATTLTLKGGNIIKLEAGQIEINGGSQLKLTGAVVLIN